MKATHIHYKHKNHLRVVESNGDVMCYAPSCSTYSKLNRPGLPRWEGEKANEPKTS